tara:strand:- start:1859 stop:2845 length:987 start_codon:yes stop_codon:yes gene_type:complete
MKNKKKYLVTGGSGFLGYSLVKKLINHGIKVVLFDNNFRGSFIKFNKSQKKNITLIKGDIRNKNLIKKAIKGCNGVFHLAFINGTENFYKIPKEVMDVGVIGTINILEKSIESKKVNFFHYASSSEVYNKPKKYPATEKEYLLIPDPSNPRFSYSGSKIIGELLTFNYLRNTKISHNIFRPHNIFGPNMGFEHVIPQIIKKIFISSNNFKKKKCSIKIQGNGEETRSFCYIDDAIDQIFQIAFRGKNKEIFNVGQNSEISIKKLIKDIARILGIKVLIHTGKLTEGSVKRRCPDMKKTFKLKKTNSNNYLNGLKKTTLWYKEFFLNEK